MSTDFYLSLYPTYQSYQALKKPRIKELEHWIIFWQIFWGLYFIDCIVDKTSGIWSWIPFSQIVWNVYAMTRFGFILANYYPRVTYFSHNTILKFMYKEAAKFWKDLKTNGIQAKYTAIKDNLLSQDFRKNMLLNLHHYYDQTHAWFFHQYLAQTTETINN